MKYFLSAILLFFVFASANAQSLFSNQRKQIISLSSDTIQLDSLSIIPESIVITDDSGRVIEKNKYQLIAQEGKLIISQQLLQEKKDTTSNIIITYKVFPFLFSKTYQHKNKSVLKPDESGAINPFIYSGSDKKANDFFASDGLNKSGSISRGVSFGNNQDVVLNSNLNLQLSGKLTDNISILAAIADDNIPIQPEGNTQQLQEFDRVYIQFNDAKSKLIAGDFQLSRPNSYFMNYFKKAQGGSFTSAFGIGNTDAQKKKNLMRVSLSAAVSKGKFARNIIQGVEGNQGPYRLTGSENESYVIVLSGSEKVYLDGMLMERGQDYDYVIDYNTAEIKFTPKRIITKDKRITVEFQYSDKNYARSLYEVGDEYENDKLKIRLHIFSEQDNKKKPLLQELKPEEKKLLAAIGDSLQNAVVPSIDTVGYIPNTVLYKAIDTLGFSGVFVYSTNADSAIYRLSFSNVGQGNGNYAQVNTAANGKVYQWIVPLAGKAQGNFEPVVLLITPKKKQMITVGADYQFTKNIASTLEVAYTKNDINTFSTKNGGNDDGYGIKFLMKQKSPLSNTKNDTLSFFSSANFELVSKYFSPIERFRAVEFEREWSRTNAAINNVQTIIGAKVGLEKKSIGNISYQLSSFNEVSNYAGLQHLVATQATKNGFTFIVNASLLNSTSTISESEKRSSQYLKYKGVLTKKIKIITVGTGVEQEQSKFRNTTTDSLLANSFHFIEWQAFVQSSDTLKNSFGLKYTNRTDFAPIENAYRKVSLGQNLTANLNLQKHENSTFKTSVTYRKLDVSDTTLITLRKDNSLIGRAEYDFKVWKGAISSATFYEVGSGLEVKKEFSYLKVQAGQGVYQWNDYNDDKIAELNEFVVATFQPLAEYIKVFTPSNQYVKTYNNQFNEVITLSPSNIWSNAHGFKKFMTVFSNQTAYRVDRKTNSRNAEKFLNPFLRETKDTTLITLNTSLRNTFYFNRFNPNFGVDYTYQDNRNKSLLVNGSEARSNISHAIKIRWNITRKWLLTNDATQGKKASASQFFPSNNYNIKSYILEPKLSFQPNVAFRATLSYELSDKKNKSDSVVIFSRGQKAGLELKYNQATKGSLLAKFNFILFKYNGKQNSSLAYEMLEGLKPGNNYTWNLTYQRTLTNNIQLNVSYDGRKSEGTHALHTGNVQVRAFF